MVWVVGAACRVWGVYVHWHWTRDGLSVEFGIVSSFFESHFFWLFFPFASTFLEYSILLISCFYSYPLSFHIRLLLVPWCFTAFFFLTLFIGPLYFTSHLLCLVLTAGDLSNHHPPPKIYPINTNYSKRKIWSDSSKILTTSILVSRPHPAIDKYSLYNTGIEVTIEERRCSPGGLEWVTRGYPKLKGSARSWSSKVLAGPAASQLVKISIQYRNWGEDWNRNWKHLMLFGRGGGYPEWGSAWGWFQHRMRHSATGLLLRWMPVIEVRSTCVIDRREGEVDWGIGYQVTFTWRRIKSWEFFCTDVTAAPDSRHHSCLLVKRVWGVLVMGLLV